MQQYNKTMINFNDVPGENTKEWNPNWPQLSDYPNRLLIIGGSGSGKTNKLLNQINNQPDIDKIYLHTTDPFEAKDQLLMNNNESIGLTHFDEAKPFS